jgi:hypothetical protein
MNQLPAAQVAVSTVDRAMKVAGREAQWYIATSCCIGQA